MNSDMILRKYLSKVYARDNALEHYPHQFTSQIDNICNYTFFSGVVLNQAKYSYILFPLVIWLYITYSNHRVMWTF